MRRIIQKTLRKSQKVIQPLALRKRAIEGIMEIEMKKHQSRNILGNQNQMRPIQPYLRKMQLMFK